MLKGKKLSILGDSVSTYNGISNNACLHPSIGGNPCFYKDPFPLEKTYWMQLVNKFGLTLCLNNSWSGGNLSGRDNPNSGVSRASNLACIDGATPDIIIVFMGLNDLGRNVELNVFFEDYLKALLTIKLNNPNAKVCCVTLPDRDVSFKKRAILFNDAIKRASELAGDSFFIADLFNSRLNNDFYYINTVDGLHPDEDGMKIISEVIGNAIIEFFQKS